MNTEMDLVTATPRLVQPEQVKPVIMTCARNVPVVGEFVTSYLAQVGSALPRPVLSVDLTASPKLPGAYWTLLNQLSPAAVYIHPRAPGMSDRDSINDAAFFALACGLEEMASREFLLFLEDDIVFSSQFVAYLLRLVLEPDAGFYTFYLPGGEYGGTVIEPYRYYGTQCLLLPRKSVEIILANRQEMEQRFSPNYDMRWAQYLGACGYKLYASLRSYVQHMGTTSRLGSGYHSSCSFVP